MWNLLTAALVCSLDSCGQSDWLNPFRSGFSPDGSSVVVCAQWLPYYMTFDLGTGKRSSTECFTDCSSEMNVEVIWTRNGFLNFCARYRYIDVSFFNRHKIMKKLPGRVVRRLKPSWHPISCILSLDQSLLLSVKLYVDVLNNSSTATVHVMAKTTVEDAMPLRSR